MKDLKSKLEFLAKDEEEAIDGYDKIIAELGNSPIVKQLKKIRDEEVAHLNFLNEAKENPDLEYEDPAHEAEQASKFPVPVIEIHRDIKTLAIRNVVPNHLTREIEFVKTEMANKIARKLIAEGFVEFFSSENKYAPIADAIEIEARVCVVKPTQEGR